MCIRFWSKVQSAREARPRYMAPGSDYQLLGCVTQASQTREVLGWLVIEDVEPTTNMQTRDTNLRPYSADRRRPPVRIICRVRDPVRVVGGDGVAGEDWLISNWQASKQLVHADRGVQERLRFGNALPPPRLLGCQLQRPGKVERQCEATPAIGPAVVHGGPRHGRSNRP